MDISARTKTFAVLGHPIDHSLSPLMHNAAFRELDIDAVYLAFDVHPDRLMPTLTVMAQMGFAGINLTVPLKEVAFRGITDLDESARRLGSVNTVQITSQGLKGHSTDGDGFLLAVKEAFGLSVKGQSIFVLGCGGAGRAVAIASAMAGAGQLLLADKEPERVKKLAAEIKSLACKTKVLAAGPDRSAWINAARTSELIVHATPEGMHKEDQPVLGPEAFHAGQFLYDLVYVFQETALMKAASQAGAQAVNGLNMLMYQGARSFAIWTGKEPPVEIMRQALQQAVYGTR